MMTTEYIKGVPSRIHADFQMYHNWSESIADHSLLIVNGGSWGSYDFWRQLVIQYRKETGLKVDKPKGS